MIQYHDTLGFKVLGSDVFERSLLWPPRLHLFDKKYSKTAILWNITINKNGFLFENILKFL